MSTDTSPSLDPPDTDEPVDEPVYARRTRPWYRPRWKPLFIRLHRWVSFAFLPLVLAYFVTGTILTLPLTKWTQGDWYQVRGDQRTVTRDQAAEIAQKRNPDLRLAWVAGAYQAGSTPVDWVVQGPDKDGVYTLTFVDMTTGTVNAVLRTGQADPSQDEFNRIWPQRLYTFTQEMHDYAFGGYHGDTPRFAVMGWKVPLIGLHVNEIVALSSALAVGWLAVSGLVLWWPGLKRWTRGFRLRRKSFYIFNYDLHHVLGFLAVPFVLLWAGTTVALVAPSTRAIWDAVTFSSTGTSIDSVFERAGTELASGSGDIGAPKARQIAQGVFPSDQVTTVYYPDPDNGAPYYQVWTSPTWFGDNGAFSGAHLVAVDAGNGKALRWPDSGSSAGTVLWDSYKGPLHYGSMVPSPWHYLWTFFGAAPVVLVFTGVVMWWRRWRNRRRRRAAALTTAAAV